MPLLAPKPLAEELQLLVSHLASGEPLGDIRRFDIQNKLKASIKSSTADAYCGLAILAAIDADEAGMRQYFTKVFEYAPSDPGYEFNYGLVLMLTKHPDEAINAFMTSLSHGLRNPKLLDDLAKDSILLNDAELQLKVLDRANKLQCGGPGILRLAALVCCANSDDPEEQANMLEVAFSDKDLRENSVLVSDEKWNSMQKLAEDLRRYL